jgi:plastocyanin
MRILRHAPVALGAFTVSAFLAFNAAAAAKSEIHIDNFVFTPQNITVPKGTTVVWTNRDDTPHRVVAVKSEFKSTVLDSDDSYSFTFNDVGSFAYFCSLHPHMTGTVTVTDK